MSECNDGISSDTDLGFDRYLWLFTVTKDFNDAGDSNIQLMPLSTGPVSRYAEFASARGETLLYTWEGLHYEGVSIIDIGTIGEHTAKVREIEYRLPVYVRAIMLSFA
jgi:hypothetical protein